MSAFCRAAATFTDQAGGLHQIAAFARQDESCSAPRSNSQGGSALKTLEGLQMKDVMYWTLGVPTLCILALAALKLMGA